MSNNFYENLYKSLNEDDDVNQDLKCLITYEDLDNNHIELDCGHKFNYKPIYLEVISQKCNSNKLETQTLKKHEIKCPYCRSIQSSLLPPNKDFDSVLYVNRPVKYTMTNSSCSYIFKSGKKNGLKCGKKCYGNMCIQHTNKIYNNMVCKDPNIITIEKDIIDLKNKNKDLYKYVKRNVGICIHENCKYRTVGLNQTCFRHMDIESKKQIKQIKIQRENNINKIKELKELIDEKSNLNSN
tara:strand:- start:20704 stop:21423 length:720 start_codon:yes stop_codon:yes gene_type:complete